MQLGWASDQRGGGVIAEHAATSAARAISFAFHLALEHEMEIMRRPPRGQTAWFLPLTGGDGLGVKRLEDRLKNLSASIARELGSPTWTPVQATTVGSLAAMADIKAANKLFEKFHPRARVLPLLTLAFFVSRGTFPRTLAFELYTRPGLTGDDARKAYGAYKTPGHARVMTLGGLAAMNAHLTVPVTMWPVVHGTWDDPSHPYFAIRQMICDATAALDPFGLRPDGSIAAFAEDQLALVHDARAIFEHAARHGSRVCDDYGIDPTQALEWALPTRVVIGQLAHTASATRQTSSVPLLPGLDADLLRTAHTSGVEVLAFAMDHMTDLVRELLPKLKKLAIVDEDEFFHGFELTDLLIGSGRWHLPGFNEIPSRVLAVIGDGALGERSDITIDTEAVQYFRIETARLKDAHRETMPVHLLVRRTSSDMVVWSTPKPLSGADANLAVQISELQLGASPRTDDSPRSGLEDFFNAVTPHKAQPAALTTRTYMNIVTMIAHQGRIGAIPAGQARAAG
jgi:hypothetical protein